MSYGECPNPRPDCKYAPNCYSDKDHLIPQRLGTTALKRAYLNLPQFKEQICRAEHDERNARHNRGDTSDIPPFPTDNGMRATIMDSIESGETILSKTLGRKLGMGE